MAYPEGTSLTFGWPLPQRPPALLCLRHASICRQRPERSGDALSNQNAWGCEAPQADKNQQKIQEIKLRKLLKRLGHSHAVLRPLAVSLFCPNEVLAQTGDLFREEIGKVEQFLQAATRLGSWRLRSRHHGGHSAKRVDVCLGYFIGRVRLFHEGLDPRHLHLRHLRSGHGRHKHIIYTIR